MNSKRTSTPRQRYPTRMIPLDVRGSESIVVDQLQQVRWRDGVFCPRCCSDRTVRNGRHGHFQRYLCKDCGLAGATVTPVASRHLRRPPHTISPSVPTQTRTLPQTRTKSTQARVKATLWNQQCATQERQQNHRVLRFCFNQLNSLLRSLPDFLARISLSPFFEST